MDAPLQPDEVACVTADAARLPRKPRGPGTLAHAADGALARITLTLEALQAGQVKATGKSRPLLGRYFDYSAAHRGVH